MQLRKLKVVTPNVHRINPVIRPMTKDDIYDVMEIIDNWSSTIFFEEIKNPFSYNFVLAWQDLIIGYLNFWIVPDGIELNNIAIHRNYRGKGFGKLLLQFLIECAGVFKVERIFLEVKEDNIIAQNLYRKFGFKKVYIRKKYYSDNKDAIVMEKSFNNAIFQRKNY